MDDTKLVRDLMMADGVGFGPSQVPPLRHCLKWVLDEIDAEDFEAMKFDLRHDLSRAVLSRADPNKDYSTETGADFTFRKLHILRALEDQYGLEEMAERFKNVLRSEKLEVTYKNGRFGLANVIEEVQKECHKYYEKKRQQGLVIDDKFVGRKKYMTAILKDLQRETTYIQGILICGMYGLGKTSLAGRICASLTKYHSICVDLRKQNTVQGALKVILNNLGRFEEPFEEVALLDLLKLERKKTLLFLDNVDDLMDFGQPHFKNRQCHDFHNLLQKIVEVDNPQVKLLVTSRFKMAQPDFISEESQVFCKQRLGGRIAEYELHQLSEEDSIQLFEMEVGILKDDLLEDEKKEIVEFCGHSPFTIQLAASHLKNSNMTLTQFMKQSPMTPLAPKSPVSPLTWYTSTSVFGDPTTQSILHTIFSGIDHVWRKKLLALSVFQGMFNVRAAQAVMESKTMVDAILDLQYLKCRHLVDMYDIQQESVDPYREQTVRFTLHTLTQQYLDKVKLQPEWQKFSDEVEQKFHQSFQDLLWEICKILKSDRLKCYQLVNENESHLRKMIFLKEKWQKLQSVEKLKHYKKQNNAVVLFQRFLDDDERLRHFSLQASLAECRQKRLSFCTYSLWKADCLFNKGDLPTVAGELKKTTNVIEDLEKSGSVPLKNLKAVKALWHYIHGRFLHKYNQPEKALRSLKKSLDFYVELFGDNYNCARSQNLMGTVCFVMNKLEEARNYHSGAYLMLKKKAPNNPHYDMPVYLMNVGTVYHRMGQENDEKHEKSEAKKNFMKALQYYNESLELFHRLNLYGNSHTGQVLRNKITVLWDLRRHEEAIELARKDMDAICRYLPDDNPDKAANVYFAGSMFMSKGKLLSKKQRRGAASEAFKQAEYLFEEAVCRITQNPNYPIQRQDYQHLKEDFRYVLRKRGKEEEWKRVRHKLQTYEAKRKLKPTPTVHSLKRMGSDNNSSSDESMDEKLENNEEEDDEEEEEEDEEEEEEQEDYWDYNDGECSDSLTIDRAKDDKCVNVTTLHEENKSLEPKLTAGCQEKHKESKAKSKSCEKKEKGQVALHNNDATKMLNLAEKLPRKTDEACEDICLEWNKSAKSGKPKKSKVHKKDMNASVQVKPQVQNCYDLDPTRPKVYKHAKKLKRSYCMDEVESSELVEPLKKRVKDLNGQDQSTRPKTRHKDKDIANDKCAKHAKKVQKSKAIPIESPKTDDIPTWQTCVIL